MGLLIMQLLPVTMSIGGHTGRFGQDLNLSVSRSRSQPRNNPPRVSILVYPVCSTIPRYYKTFQLDDELVRLSKNPRDIFQDDGLIAADWKKRSHAPIFWTQKAQS